MSNNDNLERAVEETAEQAVQTGKKSLTDKLIALFNSVKLNWNAPKPGEYTSIKEFMSYCLGIMGVCAFTFICNDTVSFTAGYLCGSIFEIKMMDFTIITFIALIVKYATLYIESIQMTIFENLGHLSKDKTKKSLTAFIICTVVGICFYFIPSKPFEGIIKGLPQIIANILVVMGIGGPVNWFLSQATDEQKIIVAQYFATVNYTIRECLPKKAIELLPYIEQLGVKALPKE